MEMSGGGAEKIPLNEMTEEACYDTLLEYGFVLPEEWEGSSREDIMEFAKECVDIAYENGGVGGLYSYTGNLKFSGRVARIVVEYEGLDDPYEGCSYNIP